MSGFTISLSIVLGAHDHPAWEEFGVVEWTAVAVASLFVVWTIWLAVKYTIKPGEDAPNHYKRLIFDAPDFEVLESWEDDDRGEE